MAAFVNDAAARPGAPSPFAVTLTGVTGGNMLVLLVWAYSNTSSITGVSDDKSNSWSQTGSTLSTTDAEVGLTAQMWTASDVASGDTTVTVTGSSIAGDGVDLYLAEISGAGVVDDSDTAHHVDTGNPSVSLTTSVDGALLIGRSAAGTSLNTVDTGSGFTAGRINQVVVYDKSEYKNDAGTAGAKTVTWTGLSGTGHGWVALAMALKPADTEPPPPAGPPLLGQACL